MGPRERTTDPTVWAEWAKHARVGRIGLYSAVIPESFGTSPSRAKYAAVVGNFAGVDERSPLLSTGALGYRVCGVTGPSSYANHSPWPCLLLFRKISPDAHCHLPQRRLVSNFREPGLSPFLLSAVLLFSLFFFSFCRGHTLKTASPPEHWVSSCFIFKRSLSFLFFFFTAWIRANLQWSWIAGV